MQRGFYAPTPGSTSCLACKPGTYGASNSTRVNEIDSCLYCPAGRFQNLEGQTQSRQPSEGFYTEELQWGNGFVPFEGSNLPIACPPNMQGSKNGTECVAAIGYFVDIEGNVTKCFSGMDCNASAILLPEVKLFPGFWRSGPTSKNVYECPTREWCAGGFVRTSSTNVEGTGVDGAEICEKGHHGPYCSVCGLVCKTAPRRDVLLATEEIGTFGKLSFLFIVLLGAIIVAYVVAWLWMGLNVALQARCHGPRERKAGLLRGKHLLQFR